MVQTGLTAAFAKAKQNLSKHDPDLLASQTGFHWDESQKFFSFTSLGDNYYVSFPDGNVQRQDSIPFAPKFALLTLHYLLAQPVPPINTWISYKEIPGGSIYQNPFQNRTVNRLFRKVSSHDLTPLITACERLGGKPMSNGDVAFKFSFFPYVQVGLVCWHGDDEFPPSGNILFDKNACCFMTAEDYAVIGEYLIERIIAHLPKE